MNWYAVSGPCFEFNPWFEGDVDSAVKMVLSSGNGIITGISPGADYLSVMKVFGTGNPGKQLRICIPVSLETLSDVYKGLSSTGEVPAERAQEVLSLINRLNEFFPEIVVNHSGFSRIREESYHVRNSRIIETCDEVYAFQLNNNLIVQDLVDQAKFSGKQVHLVRYYN